MNVYDKAYELVRAVKESGEYKETLQLGKAVAADPDAKRMLDDFRKRQLDLQQQMIAGKMPAEEEMKNMEKLFEVINLNAPIRKLFDAERRLSVIMEDIQRMIAEPLQDIFKSS